MRKRRGGLSSRERELVEAGAVGGVLECSQLSVEQLAATDDPEHIIRAEVLRDVLVKRCDKSPPDPRGVRLRGARITGTLDLTNVQAPVGMQLQGCRFDRRLLLDGAHLPWLILSGSCVPALVGDHLRVDGNLFLRDGFHTTGGDELGVVRLPGGHIGGQLDLSGAELTNQDGPALVGDQLRVDGGLILSGFHATGRGELGSVRLPGAHIGGQLNLSGAELTNNDGSPALDGGHLQVDGGLILSGFHATGGGEFGAVRLVGARIGVQLNLSGAELTNNDGGPALEAAELRVDGALFLSKKFRATGSGKHGAVRLMGARIGSQLNLRDAELTNLDGLVLDLQDAEVGHVALPPQIICPRAVTGRSACDDATRRVELDGFVYTTYDGDWRQWLHLIVRHTNQYQSQPYQQLAAVQRAAGHESDTREILIAQQQDRYMRGTIGRGLPKTLHSLGGLLGKYGYSINRIAFTLLVFLALAGALGIGAGHLPTSPGRYVAMHTPQAATPDTPCSLVEQIGVGIDRSLPLPPTGIRSRCDLDTISHLGQGMTVLFWGIQAVAWVLATMVVVGYSGWIRKAT